MITPRILAVQVPEDSVYNRWESEKSREGSGLHVDLLQMFDTTFYLDVARCLAARASYHLVSISHLDSDREALRGAIQGNHTGRIAVCGYGLTVSPPIKTFDGKIDFSELPVDSAGIEKRVREILGVE